jgi:hypothetical protein
MSSENVPATLQRRVRRRAGERCEYCRIAQAMQEATFHVDPIKPRNRPLALAIRAEEKRLSRWP